VVAVPSRKVVLAKGYGYRDVEKKLPVTSRTLMAIGSNTKSFTAIILGTLVDEKKLNLDQPVRTYMSDFQLYDEVATQLMTPRDLLIHRSGLPEHNALFYRRSFTRRELYQRLRFLEPNVTFRQRHQYNNLMVMTAGVLAERVTGQAWEELVRQRIFTPLGMTRSNTSVNDMSKEDDYSLAYGEVDNRIVAIPYCNLDAEGPAGSINSSVEEMVRYLQTNIDMGAYQGRTIFSSSMATEMQSPQSAIDHDGEAAAWGLGPASYGLGVQINNFQGRKIVFHGGAIDGFVSSMAWLPDDGMGVVVLTNSGGNPDRGIPSPIIRTLIAANVFDRLLGLAPVNRVAHAREWQREVSAWTSAMREKKFADRVPGTSTTHPLPAYVGVYDHPGYGTITITEKAGRLVLALDGSTILLEHFHYDVFRTVPAPGGEWLWGITGEHRIGFSYGKGGKIDRMQVDLEPAVPDILFTRKL
jgi:CubicO group peptidase (beta-lactamase class C family)